MNRNDLCVDILPHWHLAVDRCRVSTSSSSSASSTSTISSRDPLSSADSDSSIGSDISTVGVSTVAGVDVESAAALLRSCCKLLRLDLAEGSVTHPFNTRYQHILSHIITPTYRSTHTLNPPTLSTQTLSTNSLRYCHQSWCGDTPYR